MMIIVLVKVIIYLSFFFIDYLVYLFKDVVLVDFIIELVMVFI